MFIYAQDMFLFEDLERIYLTSKKAWSWFVRCFFFIPSEEIFGG